MQVPSDPVSSSKALVPVAGSRRQKVLGGPLAWVFLTMPLLGAAAMVALAFFMDTPERPYASVSRSVQNLEWRDRYALAQAYLAHADGMGMGPIEAHACVREIADGDDLAQCRPARADRIAMSVMLLEHMVASAGAHGGLRYPAGADEDSDESDGDEWSAPDSGECPYFEGDDSDSDVEMEMDRGGAVEI